MKNKKEWIIKGMIVAVWLGIWQAASYFTNMELLLASPVSVIRRLFVLIPAPKFYLVLGNSFLRITTGFVLAFLLGVPLGCLAGKKKLLHEFLAPAVYAMKTVPVAAFIILLLIWFGSKRISLCISFLVTFPMIYTGAEQGIRQKDPELEEMAQVFGMRHGRRIQYLYLPQVYPYVEANCRVALGMCWKAGISAEVIGLAVNTIGAQMYDAKLYLMTADLLAWSLIVVAASAVFEWIFLKILTGIRYLCVR